jgi:heme/copper-type cytochrome/quinol oxidase subunit 3
MTKTTGKFLKLLNIKQTQKHPFHVLHSSKLPIIIATLSGAIALTFIVKLHNINSHELNSFSIIAGQILDPLFSVESLDHFSVNLTILYLLAFLIIAMWCWSLNLFKESTQEGHHTLRVQLALKYGMLLFLVSEAMLFFPFFWAFFHGSLSPSIALGAIWPPIGIKDLETLDPFMLPLLNTIVLLSSGIALIAAHRAILIGHKTFIVNMMYIAISFGIFFSWLQFLEYGLTKFTINDGLYGSVFFMLTGLHGFHVIVGTTLLIISYWRTVINNFSTNHHIGFETAAWYWHFVDVVWLGVFAFVYIWGV